MNTTPDKHDTLPGPHERHLLRKHNNPLFGDKQITLTDDLLKKARQKDRNFSLQYQREFHDLLEKTAALKPNEESDVILGLKERLDRLYEMSAAIADESDELRPMIKKLLQVIMAAVRKGAGNDFQAQNELDQEELAREAHFKLLESPLVADLLNPESPIESDELTATLLSAEKNDLLLAIQIFDEAQLLLVLNEAEKILAQQNLPEQFRAQTEESQRLIRDYVVMLQNNRVNVD